MDASPSTVVTVCVDGQRRTGGQAARGFVAVGRYRGSRTVWVF